MKETPIIMSGNHPRLILDELKTMTRRVIKPQYIDWQEHHWYGKPSAFHLQFNDSTLEAIKTHCPYGQVGDRLWVRETWHSIEHPTDEEAEFVTYKATAHPHILKTVKWRPSIFMPRWASRITLEITEVRVERLQEITYQDIWAEGCPTKNGTNVYFRTLWDSLNAKRGYGWMTNPWLWVISFKLVNQ